MPVMELACFPRFFQLMRSVDEYNIGVWSPRHCQFGRFNIENPRVRVDLLLAAWPTQ